MIKTARPSYASKKLGISTHRIRCMIRSGKTTFGVAYKSSPDSSQYTYVVDVAMVDKCAKGIEPLFKD